MTALEKVLRYTRSTKSRKARLDAHFAREATHVLTRAELEEQLNAVPNQHKAGFLYLPSAYQNSQNLLAQTDFRSFDKVNANVEMEDGVAKLVTQAVNGHHFLEESFVGASAAEEDVTIRVQAKANGKRYLMLQVEGNGENSEDAWIDLQTGEFFTRQTLPADFDEGAVAAFGLQQLSDDIGDNSITVVRSSDEAERDFTLDEIIDGTLLSFVNEEITDNINTTTDSNADGLADGLFSSGSAITSIVTGNGHIGSAQRIDYNTSGSALQTFQMTTLPPIIGQEITISFLYRSNITIEGIGNAYSTGGPAFVDIPANTGDAIRFEAKAVWSPTGGNDGRIQPMWLRNSGDFIEISDWSVTYHTADGLVKVWYDQALSNDASQTTPANQPKIVSAGSLVTENGKPAIDFDGVDDEIGFLADISATEVSSVIVAKAITYVINDRFFGWRNSTHSSLSVLIQAGNSTTLRGLSQTSVNSQSLQYTGVDYTNQSLISMYNASVWRINGNEFTTAGTAPTTGVRATNGLTLGSRGDGNNNGNIRFQEVIFYPSDQSSNRKNIERKLADIMERPQLIEGHTDAGLINNITTIVGDDGWVDCFVSLKSVATTGIYRIGCSDEPKYKHYTGDGTGILLRKPQMYNGTVKRDFVPYNKPTLSIESLAIVGSDLTIDRDSKATNVNRELLLEEVEADVPRFQFSEDGYEGHLIEGQGTNLFVFSDPDLEGRLGSRLNASLSLNDWGIGLFSNKLILDNTSGGALWYPNESVIIASGLPATICAFTRVIDGLSPTFGPNSNQGYFNVGGSTASAHYVTNLGNDIYFVYAHGISNGATNTGFLRWTSNAPGQIEITGMMLLEGHVHLTPSDYIPTNGAAATRLDEAVTELSYTPSLQWTLFVNCSDYQDGGISGDDQFRFRNANGNLLFHLWGLAQGFTLRSQFGDTSGNYYTNTTPGRTPSVVIRYDGAEINIFYSGEKVLNYGGRSITETQWGNLATFQIPRTDNTFNLKRMGVLPYAATDEQCQTLSAL